MTKTLLKTYSHVSGNVTINYTNHGLSVGNVVYLDWMTGNVSSNTVEGPYSIRLVPNAEAFVINSNSYLANTLLPATSGNVYVGTIIS